MSESSPDIELYNASVAPAIGDLSSSVKFPVKTGASTTAYNRIAAASISSTNVQFNVNTNPQHIIDREFHIRSKISVTCRITRAATSKPSDASIDFQLGDTDALRPFPVNQMVNVVTATIGSQQITLSQRDVFDMLLKCVPKKYLSRANSTCPSFVDSSFKDYASRPDSCLNDPLQGFEDALLADMIPNGAFPIEVGVYTQYTTAGVITYPDTPGEWAATAAYVDIPLTFTVDEPLFVSPFIFQNDTLQNKSGIFGVNTFGVQMVMTGDPNHMFCSSAKGRNYHSLNIQSIDLHYLSHTAQNGVVLPIKSVIPYKQVERYSTNMNVGSVLPNGYDTITSPNINIGHIPDHFVIAVRRRRTEQTLNTASSAFFPIESITVKFGNQTNLLASCTMEDLWRLSGKNGSTQSFHEFRGRAMVGIADNSGIVNTVGSLVVVSTTDLQLPSPLAPSVLANADCTFQVRFHNNEDTAVTPELVVIAVSDGVMTIMNGTVSLSKTLLTEGVVAQTLSLPAVKELPEMLYPKRGGTLSSAIAKKMSSGIATGAGVMSGGGVRSAGAMSGGKTSLFY